MSSNGSDRVEAISGMKSGNSKKAILKSETYNARIARDNLTKEVASLRKTMGVQSNDDAEKLSLIKKINEMEKESENLLTPGDETIEELIVNISWLETELEGRKAESIHKETICLRAENKHRLQLQEVEKEMKKMEMEIKFYQNENFSLRRMMMETTLPEQQPALKELFKMTLKLDTLENNFYESRKSINTKLINYMEVSTLLLTFFCAKHLLETILCTFKTIVEQKTLGSIRKFSTVILKAHKQKTSFLNKCVSPETALFKKLI